MTSTGDHFEVHPLSKSGFAPGTNELYDKVRPSYPAEALSHLRKAVAAKDSLNVVEIGSGTGKFTKSLLSYPEWASSIAELRAIDPSEGMREVFLRSVKDARVKLSDGTFDKTGVESGWADMIVIAHAFHWVLDYEASAQEFSRVLKPNGVVALAWNFEDRKTAVWVDETERLSDSFRDRNASLQQTLKWKQFFDTPAYAQAFQPPEETFFRYNLPGTTEIVIERLLSRSFITILTDEEKQQLRDTTTKIVDTGDGKVWINEEEGLFEYPYFTVLYVFHNRLTRAYHEHKFIDL